MKAHAQHRTRNPKSNATKTFRAINVLGKDR